VTIVVEAHINNQWCETGKICGPNLFFFKKKVNKARRILDSPVVFVAVPQKSLGLQKNPKALLKHCVAL